MRITDIKGHVVSIPGPQYHWRKGLPPEPPERDIFLLRILTDEGIEGNAIWHHHGRIMGHIAEDYFKPLYVGEDPLDREKLWHKAWDADRIKMFPIYAQGSFDVALWDIAGKKAKMPLAKLLGQYRDKIPAYASTLTMDSVEAYGPLTEWILERGYKAIKLHCFGEVRRDIEACRLVREVAGDDIVLMLDASGAYDHEEALWAAKELEKLNYYWFEEPMRDYDNYGYRELRKRTSIPICVAETTWGTFFDVANQIMAGTVDIIHSDWFLKAGLTGLMKTAHLCEAFGIKVQVHGGGFPNLQASLAIKNTEYHEQIVPEDTFHFLLKNPPITPDQDGFVTVPELPGLGLDIDWEQVKKYTVREV